MEKKLSQKICGSGMLFIFEPAESDLHSEHKPSSMMSSSNKEIVPKFSVAVLRRKCTSEPDYKCIRLDCNEVTIGRSKENSFVIVDLLISRKDAVFRLHKDQWTIESVGINIVAANNIIAPKNLHLPIQHMDTMDFGAGNKFVYDFLVQSSTSEVN